jgi:hypothetical protein
MSARTSGSRLTGIRPDLSGVVRMTKEEGPWKHSPGFSLGWDFNPMVRPHKVLLWSAHGEKHPPCRVGAAERAQELSNPYRSSALAGRSRGRWNSPRLKPGPSFPGSSSFVILTTADRSGRALADDGSLVQVRGRAPLPLATAAGEASIADQLTTESVLHYFPRSPISPAELRMLDLTRRPDRIL